jgi:uncharacterized protein with PIN domain
MPERRCSCGFYKRLSSRWWRSGRSTGPSRADADLAYGKGRHRAGLNFGDCMTYAVAKLAGEPLLCLGDDFPATDLEVA